MLQQGSGDIKPKTEAEMERIVGWDIVNMVTSNCLYTWTLQAFYFYYCSGPSLLFTFTTAAYTNAWARSGRHIPGKHNPIFNLFTVRMIYFASRGQGFIHYEWDPYYSRH